jgi:hypothetical protein
VTVLGGLADLNRTDRCAYHEGCKRARYVIMAQNWLELAKYDFGPKLPPPAPPKRLGRKTHPADFLSIGLLR